MDRGPCFLFAQVGLAVIAMLGFAFAPPAQGRMLLLPLPWAQDAAAPAIEGGARLIGAGPWHGSWVVEGRRERLAGAVFSDGIMMLSAPPSWCGGASGEDDAGK